ncbi:aryl-alcohol oxidase-like protein [Mycena epipterygia]|nr:aryl-alcohol oxidase-like protein [Mycena epipterygia]
MRLSGGGAGNVVANRLTENPNFSVLVLEAGPSPEGLLNYTVPFFNMYLREIGNPRDWNYTTTVLTGLDGRVLTYPRGRLLGGCTSMNGMQYMRGSKDDHDRYARVSGDPGWAWDAIQPYIRKNEHWTRPTDNHNETGQFNPAVHGFHGINAVSLSGFPNPVDLDNRVAQVTQELSDEFPFNLDYNSGFPLGVTWDQATIKHGKRSSSFTSYLAPEFIGRPNLHVLLNSQATRIIQTSQTPKNFLTVEFAQTKEGPRYQISASKEVILSGGTLETPKLLLNSGIGESAVLSNLGIQPRVDLPDVGKNLSVHIGVGQSYFVNGSTFDDIIRNATLRQVLLNEWLATNGGGRLGVGYGTHDIFVRLPADSPAFAAHPDPAPGSNSPHILSGAQNGNLNPPPEGNFVSVGATLLTPTSRGTVQLNNSDPFTQPIIDLGCLTTDFDIVALREGMKSSLRFIGANAWQGYVLGSLNNITNATSDADLESFARAHATPNGHVGTASMSPKGANYGVVDPDFRVKGVEQLRVVDASILPFLPAGYTQAVVYILAERAADLIKQSWE